MASVHDKLIEEQFTMSPKYPLYIFNNEESVFQEFVSPDDLWYCEEPDILDGMYEGWDSTGRHFELTWNESTKTPQIKFIDHQKYQQSLDILIGKLYKYESMCIDNGILFSEFDKAVHDPGRLCDPRRLRGAIKEIGKQPGRSDLRP